MSDSILERDPSSSSWFFFFIFFSLLSIFFSVVVVIVVLFCLLIWFFSVKASSLSSRGSAIHVFLVSPSSLSLLLATTRTNEKNSLNSMWRRLRELNPGQIAGSRVLANISQNNNRITIFFFTFCCKTSVSSRCLILSWRRSLKAWRGSGGIFRKKG